MPGIRCCRRVLDHFFVRGLWTSALYADGAKYLVGKLGLSLQEFRDLCDSVEEAGLPKERFFDRFKNIHQVDNLKAFTSWGLSQEEQKSVVMAYPQLTERKTRHLEAFRKWYMDEFQVPPNDFRDSFTKYPWLLSRATEWQVAEIVEIFRDMDFQSSHLQILLRDAPRVFHFPSPKQVNVNIQAYLDMRISCDQLVDMLVKEPELLGYSFVMDMRKKMKWMLRLGIRKEEVVREILVKNPDLMLRAWIVEMDDCLKWLRGKGVKDHDIQRLAVQNPKVFLKTSIQNINAELMQCKDKFGIDYL